MSVKQASGCLSLSLSPCLVSWFLPETFPTLATFGVVIVGGFFASLSAPEPQAKASCLMTSFQSHPALLFPQPGLTLPSGWPDSRKGTQLPPGHARRVKNLQ